MFDFLKRKVKKPVVLDFYTCDPTAHEFYKPQPTMKFAPENWKSMPSVTTQPANNHPYSKMSVEQSTMKRCNGLTRLFNNGFVIPAWVDMQIETMEDGNIITHCAHDQRLLDGVAHERSLMWKGLYEQWAHYKIHNKWYVFCDEEIEFMQTECTWNNTEEKHKYRIVNGIVDFKYQHGTHVNMFTIPNNIIKFSAGDPLSQWIALTDRPLKMNYHLVNQIPGPRNSTYTRIYAHNRKTQKEIESKSESKCPFGFGSK
jgi:hypothetical protein